MRSHSSCLYHTGQSLLMDFGLCASTRLVFFTLISRCWWTLACALPLVLSFFDTGQSLLVDIGLCAPTRLVFFDIGLSLLVDFGLCSPTHDLCASTRLVFFDTGQSLLVDFGLCASTRLVFLTLVIRCWRTLACALPLVLSFF